MDTSNINNIFAIAKCEQLEIRIALEIAVQFETQLKALDINQINKIFAIAKYERFEIESALELTTKFDREFKVLTGLKYVIDEVKAEANEAEKRYDLNKAAKLKYEQLEYLEKKLQALTEEIKDKSNQYLTRNEEKPKESLKVNTSNLRDRRRRNNTSRTANQQSPVSTTNSVNTQEPQRQLEQLTHECVFRSLKEYLHESLRVEITAIDLESKIFLGDCRKIKSIGVLFSGDTPSKINYSEREDIPDNSLGMDNLDGLELLMFIEDEFDIEISDNYEDKTMTVQELVDLILKLHNDSE